MRKLLIALALAGAWENAGAQAIYKYTTPEGNVVYTDSPAAGLNGARKLEIAALSPRAYDAERGAPTAPEQPSPAAESAAAAQSEYRAAKRRRIEGVTPLAEERNGPYFRAEYWQRQRALTQGLMLARTRLAQANAPAAAQRPVYALAQLQR
jgi:hypothetical protein